MTVVIASHQRRTELARLLRALAQQLGDDPHLQPGLDVVIVLDGSTDGSAEMLQRLAFPVPLRTIEHAPPRGLAATRNRGLAACGGELVWFLDDDLAPAPGLVARHRHGHAAGVERVLVGPCPVPADALTLAGVKQFWAERYGELAASGRIERFDRFSAANTSGSVALFRRVGGFDEAFVGYGLEDYELACRLLDADACIRFDPHAVAWHPQRRTLGEMYAAKVDEGRNTVRLIALHPHAAGALVDDRRTRRSVRALGRLGRLAPRALRGLADATSRLAAFDGRVRPGASERLSSLALDASFAAGVAEADADGTVLPRLLSGRLRSVDS